jgi:hypothetical protein
MNDNDLERDLRSQRGPREEGYTPAVLPMTREEAPVRASGVSRLPRAAMFAGVAVAGALAVALVAGIFSGPGSDVGSGSASPSAAASAPAVAVCAPAPADVTFSAEPWGGAAGSRGTTVTVTLADGRYPCALGGRVAALISDANGTLLVSGQSAAVGSVDLEPNTAFTLGVAWSNWCGNDPAAPVSLSLKIEGWTSAVPVSVPAGANPVPPCNGAGAPSSLSVTALEPAP